jgi:apolipoprotein N-acyltransferase
MPTRAVAVTVGVLLTVTVAAWKDVFDLGQMLGIAGMNFLLLYAGAAAVLFKLAERGWQRALAGGSLALVALLLAVHDIAGLIYPALLIGAAALVALARRSRAPINLEPGE